MTAFQSRRFSTKLMTQLLFACLLVQFANVSDARADAQDMRELDQTEMQSLCGGFTLPNGVDLNVGIDNRISVNGMNVADANLNLTGNTITASSTGTVQVPGANGSTNIISLNALGSGLITNTANNQTISQMRTINIDIANYSKLNLQTASSFAMAQAQIMASMRPGRH